MRTFEKKERRIQSNNLAGYVIEMPKLSWILNLMNKQSGRVKITYRQLQYYATIEMNEK